MKSEAPKLYLDANIFIYAVEGGSRWTDALHRLFRRIYLGDFETVTSELTVAEVLAKPYRLGEIQLARNYEAILSPPSPIFTASLDRQISRRAAEIRGISRLKLADAIHLATALEPGCDYFVSNDHPLLAALPDSIVACDLSNLEAL